MLIPAGTNPTDPTTRPRERVDGKGDVPVARTAVLGFPRIGAKREMKAALEDYWAGRSSTAALEATAREIRAANLWAGTQAGIDVLPVGDFSLYDHVLDVAEMVTLSLIHISEPTRRTPISYA